MGIDEYVVVLLFLWLAGWRKCLHVILNSVSQVFMDRCVLLWMYVFKKSVSEVFLYFICEIPTLFFPPCIETHGLTVSKNIYKRNKYCPSGVKTLFSHCPSLAVRFASTEFSGQVRIAKVVKGVVFVRGVYVYFCYVLELSVINAEQSATVILLHEHNLDLLRAFRSLCRGARVRSMPG